MRRAPAILAILWCMLTALPALGSAYDGRPKLVVVIVVDQLRADYLERHRAQFGENGFRLLMDRGAYFLNCAYDYANTSTAPGHATLATGSYSNGHGILNNDWWDPASKKMVAAVTDNAASVVGVRGEGPSASPRNLLTSTLGDELKLATQGKSRVFATALKDRAAVFSAGFTADGVYWTDPASGSWVTSTFYADKLPEWVEEFNHQKRVDKYWDQEWKDSAGKVLRSTRRTPESSFSETLGDTPFAMEYQFEFARELITQEKLGSGATTDLLIIGVSTPDILGHKVGPDGAELHALLAELDRQMGSFFGFLGRQIGLANTWIALSSDHGVFHPPAQAAKLRLPAESMNNNNVRDQLNADLGAHLGAKGSYVAQVRWPRVYLNAEAFAPRKMDQAQAERAAGEAMLRLGMRGYFTKSQLARGEVPPGALGKRYLNSYSPHSGWYVFGVPSPFAAPGTNATHGSAFTYDRRVPMAFFGLPFQAGEYRGAAEPVDLATTLASLLGINPPATATGRVLTEALRPATGRPGTTGR